MRSTLTRSATRLDARDALIGCILICAVLAVWQGTRSPRAVHAGVAVLQIVVDYCLSTS
jgi:hypothetical protein